MWETFKHGECKSIKKASITDPNIASIISKYSTSTRKDGSEAASYTFVNEDAVIEFMRECEGYIRSLNLPDLPLKTQIQNSLDILGYVDVATGEERDRRRLLITDVMPMKSKDGTVWSYRASTRSLGSGKTARITIRERVYEKNPFKVGDIIYAAHLYKNEAGYWYLTDYSKE